jgi:hypothetical protein
MKKLVMSLIVCCTAFLTVSRPASADEGNLNFTFTGDNGVTVTGWLDVWQPNNLEWQSFFGNTDVYYVGGGEIDVSATPAYLAANPNFVTGFASLDACGQEEYVGEPCRLNIDSSDQNVPYFFGSIIAWSPTGWSIDDSLLFSFSNTTRYPVLQLAFGDGEGSIDELLSQTFLYGGVVYGIGGSDSGTFITPEPSSFLLFGTGLLGLAGVGLRCFAPKLGLGTK